MNDPEFGRTPELAVDNRYAHEDFSTMKLIQAFFIWLFAIGLGVGQPNAAFALEVPEQGTPKERATKLWQARRPVIVKDAKANYSDEEYMKRRRPVWNAWIGLQMATASENAAVSKLIPDVLRLFNDVYGWTADSPAKRQEIATAFAIRAKIGSPGWTNACRRSNEHPCGRP